MERNSVHPTNRDALLLRSESRSHATTSSDFVLQWGNRKRLRCMKFQAKDNASASGPAQRAMTRIDRRVVRSDFVSGGKNPVLNHLSNGNAGKSNGGGNGYLNLRQRPASPSHRILRNSEMSSIGTRGGHSNGGDRKGGTLGNNNSTSNNNDSHHGGSASSTITAVWPPKFVMGLTNKEKEEDFMAIKGSKLPQRPKKRAKYIQRTLNLVSPGAWLSDLTLERCEVREKKVSKKKARRLWGEI